MSEPNCKEETVKHDQDTQVTVSDQTACPIKAERRARKISRRNGQGKPIETNKAAVLQYISGVEEECQTQGDAAIRDGEHEFALRCFYMKSVLQGIRLGIEIDDHLQGGTYA